MKEYLQDYLILAKKKVHSQMLKRAKKVFMVDERFGLFPFESEGRSADTRLALTLDLKINQNQFC